MTLARYAPGIHEQKQQVWRGLSLADRARVAESLNVDLVEEVASSLIHAFHVTIRDPEWPNPEEFADEMLATTACTGLYDALANSRGPANMAGGALAHGLSIRLAARVRLCARSLSWAHDALTIPPRVLGHVHVTQHDTACVAHALEELEGLDAKIDSMRVEQAWLRARGGWDFLTDE